MKYYNSITKETINIEVSLELETEIKRSYWREQKSEQRYKARMLEFWDHTNYEQICSIEDKYIRDEEIKVLHKCLRNLNSKEQDIIYYIYYLGYTKAQTAEMFGCSDSYMCRLVKQIKEKLRKDILSVYDYYA